ncbi:Uncharacterised protein [Moraxella lacunata]|uniref:Uncharacterized protein n=1 Tax=Moraxella lacunata TaxID=477 RepID=A0A378T6P2_MORLA|nr:hypothetical protein [Moraxella lacunata]STZ55545.1 Uncharacterised protein [Moraxella lacunata]
MNDRDYQDFLDSLPDDIQAQMESDYYEYERYLHETGQVFDELPF